MQQAAYPGVSVQAQAMQWPPRVIPPSSAQIVQQQHPRYSSDRRLFHGGDRLRQANNLRLCPSNRLQGHRDKDLLFVVFPKKLSALLFKLFAKKCRGL